MASIMTKCFADALARRCVVGVVREGPSPKRRGEGPSLRRSGQAPSQGRLVETGLLQLSSQEGGVSETLSERLRRPLEIKDASGPGSTKSLAMLNLRRLCLIFCMQSTSIDSVGPLAVNSLLQDHAQ